ncbi:hypothetical protein HYX17_04465 [Candidatus Woesearchaeota archaeon]|nr:hypothetical protein [Candidatus Woesearchaeota archaeon]
MKVALIGVPIETHWISEYSGYIYGIDEPCDLMEDYSCKYSVYSPDSTDEIRKTIREIKKNDILIEDIGELNLSGPNNEESKTHRHYKNERLVGLEKMKKQRKFVLGLKRHFDRIVCIGPSHFGAILLYEETDNVARFDFHGDYTIHEYPDIISSGLNHASYMHTVEREFRPRIIINYGWKNREESMDYLGEIAQIESGRHKESNHFDIDVDCFDSRLGIASTIHCGDLHPKQLEKMALEAQPKKIGIWEYRGNYDHGNGKKFIENVVFNCSQKALKTQILCTR